MMNLRGMCPFFHDIKKKRGWGEGRGGEIYINLRKIAKSRFEGDFKWTPKRLPSTKCALAWLVNCLVVCQK